MGKYIANTKQRTPAAQLGRFATALGGEVLVTDIPHGGCRRRVALRVLAADAAYA